jgi:hypothetical protein
MKQTTIAQLKMARYFVKFGSEPVRFQAVAEATLQHAVASDFTQVRAAQAPESAGNGVLFDQWLPGPEKHGEQRR